MIRLEDLRNNVQDWIENELDTDQTDRAINRAIRQVQKLCDWEALRRIKTVTPDSTGLFTEPPLTDKIRYVYTSGGTGWPSSAFVNIKEQNVDSAAGTYSGKFLPYGPTLVVTEEDLIVDVIQGSSTIAQATSSTEDIDISWVGERFQLEGDSTTYEITAAVAATSLTVYPSVRRSTLSSLTCIVSPMGQKQYKVLYSNGTAYSEAIDVHYQMAHQNLIDTEDLLFIPAEQLVTLFAVQFFLHQTKYDVDARALQLAISDAKRDELAQEPSSSYQSQKHDNLFGVRSRTGRRQR